MCRQSCRYIYKFAHFCIVTSARGRTLRYHKLLLATGSAALVPPILGREAPGCFVYRTIDDLEAIRAKLPQEQINALLVERARAGQQVARLKGGDPYLFGRGGEEAQALVRAGLSWEVVPGVSSGVAAAAYAGIPLLHRDHASTVTFISGHAGRLAEGLDAAPAATLAVFMCTRTIVEIAGALLARELAWFGPSPRPIESLPKALRARAIGAVGAWLRRRRAVWS